MRVWSRSCKEAGGSPLKRGLRIQAAGVRTMPVFKPRNRLVNFRLSEEEFEKLRASCALTGARSLSDFARAAVMRSVGAGPDSNATGERGGQIGATRIDQKVYDLESRVGELMHMIQALRRDGGTGDAHSTRDTGAGVARS